jgi:hypothetical protein
LKKKKNISKDMTLFDMSILNLGDALSHVKGKKVLFDTNILIDGLIKPTVFESFFDKIRETGCKIMSIEPVAFEFLQGLPTEEKYTQRYKILNEIIDEYVPITKETFNNAYKLIKLFGIEGKGLEITDLLLGAVLMEYPEGYCFLRRILQTFQ